jgi:uncharacterized membrane protein YphA (DoxX/SURF4 family)
VPQPSTLPLHKENENMTVYIIIIIIIIIIIMQGNVVACSTEIVSAIIACSLVAVETCPKSCSLGTAVILSPVYVAVTWQWVYMSEYKVGEGQDSQCSAYDK